MFVCPLAPAYRRLPFWSFILDVGKADIPSILMISFVIVESAGTDKVLKPPKPPGKSSFTIVTSGSKEEPILSKLSDDMPVYI